MTKFRFDSIEHALAAVAHDTVVGARAAAAAVGKLQKFEPAVENITEFIDPPAVIIERAAFAALGMLAKAANDTATVTSDKGLNVSMDQQTLQEYKNLYEDLATLLKTLNENSSTSVTGDLKAAATSA
jgi:hypothetical protein